MHQTVRLSNADIGAWLSVPKDVTCSFASVLEDGSVILLEALYTRAMGLGQATYPCLYTDSKALWCHATEGG